MNRGAIFSGLAAVSMVLACGGTEVDLGSRPQFSLGTSTLTVLLQDGIERSDIVGATVTMRVGPNVLTAKAAGNAYTFTNVPNGDNSFPIVAQAAGYLDFAGVSPNLVGGVGVADPSYLTRTVLMYSTQTVAQDYTIEVFDGASGAAVSGGQVVLTLKTNPATDIVTIVGAAALAGSYGYHSGTMVYPLSGGTATIPGADLIFGAEYTIDVIGATDANGDYLTQDYVASTGSLKVPNTYKDITVVMVAGERKPTVLAVSNEDAANGVNPTNAVVNDATAPLTVLFAEPVEDCSDPDVLEYTNASSGTISPPTAKNATLAFSNVDIRHQAKLSLVSAAAWTTVPTAAANPGLSVTYVAAAAKVRIVGTTGTDNCVSIVGLAIRGDTANVVSGVINVFPTP